MSSLESEPYDGVLRDREGISPEAMQQFEASWGQLTGSCSIDEFLLILSGFLKAPDAGKPITERALDVLLIPDFRLAEFSLPEKDSTAGHYSSPSYLYYGAEWHIISSVTERQELAPLAARAIIRNIQLLEWADFKGYDTQSIRGKYLYLSNDLLPYLSYDDANELLRHSFSCLPDLEPQKMLLGLEKNFLDPHIEPAVKAIALEKIAHAVAASEQGPNRDEGLEAYRKSIHFLLEARVPEAKTDPHDTLIEQGLEFLGNAAPYSSGENIPLFLGIQPELERFTHDFPNRHLVERTVTEAVEYILAEGSKREVSVDIGSAKNIRALFADNAVLVGVLDRVIAVYEPRLAEAKKRQEVASERAADRKAVRDAAATALKGIGAPVPPRKEVPPHDVDTRRSSTTSIALENALNIYKNS